MAERVQPMGVFFKGAKTHRTCKFYSVSSEIYSGKKKNQPPSPCLRQSCHPEHLRGRGAVVVRSPPAPNTPPLLQAHPQGNAVP